KGRCLDNIFIERLWRFIKYECVYLHAWETGSQAKVGVGRWIIFHNHKRPHAAHGGQPPAMVYFNQIETDQRVALDLSRFLSGQVLLLGGPLFEDHG
ncbi:integrase core domain-containing protein, partial [Paracoccus sp. (in: a-proteobacteria)]|uniref:integrase core domain-containing protein n=1 Tax=Paracoccus sp. TaxID=267 RepID=UPI00333F81D5